MNDLAERLAAYGFRDQVGHPIENCVEFRVLLSKDFDLIKAWAQEIQTDVKNGNIGDAHKTACCMSELLDKTPPHENQIVTLQREVRRLSALWSQAHYGDDDAKASEIRCQIEEIEAQIKDAKGERR